jgi:hypothetical protein
VVGVCGVVDADLGGTGTSRVMGGNEANASVEGGGAAGVWVYRA